jgi:UPF0148 protein
MAELLRSGARMLSKSCPECDAPLFQLKTGEIWCAKCQRRVVIISDAESIEIEVKLDSLERSLISKFSSLESEIMNTNDPFRLRELIEVLNSLLSALEKLKRIKKS